MRKMRVAVAKKYAAIMAVMTVFRLVMTFLMYSMMMGYLTTGLTRLVQEPSDG